MDTIISRLKGTIAAITIQFAWAGNSCLDISVKSFSLCKNKSNLEVAYVIEVFIHIRLAIAFDCFL